MKKMTKFKPEILKERIEKSGKSMETLSKEIGRYYGYIRSCMKKGYMSEESWQALNAILGKKEALIERLKREAEVMTLPLEAAPKECCSEKLNEKVVEMNEELQRQVNVTETLRDRIDKLEGVIARVSLANVDILDRLEKVEKKKRWWWK